MDASRSRGGQPLVLLFEPGTGMSLEIPTTFAELIDVELVESSDAALADGFFEEWCTDNPTSAPLSFAECVGYKVPLFLGGSDEISNLEVSDLDVYWTMSGQLRVATLGMPAGTQISGVFDEG